MFTGPAGVGSPQHMMSALRRRESFAWFGDGGGGGGPGRTLQRLRRKMRSHSMDEYDCSPPCSPTGNKSGESRPVRSVSHCGLIVQHYRLSLLPHVCWYSEW